MKRPSVITLVTYDMTMDMTKVSAKVNAFAIDAMPAPNVKTSTDE